MLSFEGKTALVSGAASGIGKETARRFAQRGARVTCADKNGAGAAATAADIEAAGGKAEGITLDVTEPGQVSAVIDEAARHRASTFSSTTPASPSSAASKP